MKKVLLKLNKIDAFAKKVLLEAEKSSQCAMSVNRRRSASSCKNGALVFALMGNLGGGKTTFTQALARVCGAKSRIKSPTFVLMKKHPIVWAGRKTLVHIDAYRFDEEKESGPLGLPEIFSNPGNIVVIEWADRIQNLLPRDTHKLFFEFIDKNTRKIQW